MHVLLRIYIAVLIIIKMYKSVISFLVTLVIQIQLSENTPATRAYPAHCEFVIKFVYISAPSFYDYELFYKYILLHVLIGLILFNLKNYMKVHVDKSHYRRHRHTCMYMHTMNCFFTCIDEPAAARQATGLAMGA